MDSDQTPETVSLSPEEIACLAEYQQALTELQKKVAEYQQYQQALRDVQQQAQGVLRLILAQRNLKGTWKVQGDALVRGE